MDFVEKKERLPWNYRFTGQHFEVGRNGPRCQVPLEHAVPVAVPLKIHSHHFAKVVVAELADGVGLADLTRAPHDKGLAAPGLLPAKQFLFDHALHCRASVLKAERESARYRSKDWGIIAFMRSKSEGFTSIAAQESGDT